MNGLRGMLGGNSNAGGLVKNCENHAFYHDWNINSNQIDQVSGTVTGLRWLKGNHNRNLAQHLQDLKFGTKAVSLTFKNHITGGVSGVIAKAFMANRHGENIESKAFVGTSTCDMNQPFTIHKHTHCTNYVFFKKCKTTTKNIPRGFTPQELNQVLNSLQYAASKSMYDEGVRRTGLRSDEADSSLQSLYIQESHTLRRFYPEIQYDYTEMENVPHQDLQNAIRIGSLHQIQDGFVYQRIHDVAGPHARSSFFHAPNNNIIFVMSVNREGANFRVRMSSFKVNGRMPAGAFGSSAGAWSLERPGQGTAPSSNELMRVFPALK